LVMVDVDTGELSEMADGKFRKVTVSPDGRFAALIVEGGPILRDESVPIRWPRRWPGYPSTFSFHTSLEIIRLGSKSSVRRFPQVVDPGFDFVPHGPNGPPSPGFLETYSGPQWLAHQTKV